MNNSNVYCVRLFTAVGLYDSIDLTLFVLFSVFFASFSHSSCLLFVTCIHTPEDTSIFLLLWLMRRRLALSKCHSSLVLYNLLSFYLIFLLPYIVTVICIRFLCSFSVYYAKRKSNGTPLTSTKFSIHDIIVYELFFSYLLQLIETKYNERKATQRRELNARSYALVRQEAMCLRTPPPHQKQQQQKYCHYECKIAFF